MYDLIPLYKERLELEGASFSPIEHDDAIVAIVYKVALAQRELILKICKPSHHFFREIYFLKYFAGKIPVPQIVKTVQPGFDVFGAVLMDYLPGKVLKIKEFTEELSYEMGMLLARIHLERAKGFGDLIQPQFLSPDPRIHFAEKFEESFAECKGHLPSPLMKEIQTFYVDHLDLLKSVDGPCIVHRDYRPGNVIVDHGKIKGIIDWSSGRAGFAEEDFCSMEHGEWSVHPESKGSFLAGYASIRPVPNYEPVMPLLRISKAIATIGYLVKREIWKSSGAYLYQLNRIFLDRFEF
ncbi:MAG: aminoglycoside phosphotransferase family protein [Parachlamydiales bacterium]|nr:aminoglycoside phosphotransferase family protein [Parachlamydiales bacterium]